MGIAKENNKKLPRKFLIYDYSIKFRVSTRYINDIIMIS